MGSIGDDAAPFARAVHGHWRVETDLHWSLDSAIRDDEPRLQANVPGSPVGILDETFRKTS